MVDYPPDQLWPLYEKLPPELKEAIFSERTAEAIRGACERNGLQKEVSQIAKYAGYVLLGLLSPAEFQKVLQDEMKLANETAKKVAYEINRFVFFPVKGDLEALYGTEKEAPEEKPALEKQTGRKKKVDVYREPIEE